MHVPQGLLRRPIAAARTARPRPDAVAVQLASLQGAPDPRAWRRRHLSPCIPRPLHSPCMAAHFFFLILRLPPIPPLFPYTTLFRSNLCSLEDSQLQSRGGFISDYLDLSGA